MIVISKAAGNFFRRKQDFQKVIFQVELGISWMLTLLTIGEPKIAFPSLRLCIAFMVKEV